MISALAFKKSRSRLAKRPGLSSPFRTPFTKMKSLHLTLLPVIGALAGCSTANVVPEPTPTLNAEYVAQYAGSFPDNTKRPLQYIDKDSHFRQLTISASRSSDPAEISKWLRSGFSLANIYCAEYFEGLTQRQAKLNYTKAQTNIIGGLASGTLGIFEAPASTIATVAASFAAIGASLDSVNSNFLLAPNIEGVKSLVENAQGSIQTQSMAATYPDFATAQSVLVRYVELCTFGGVKRLIDESVKNAKVVADTQGRVTIASTENLALKLSEIRLQQAVQTQTSQIMKLQDEKKLLEKKLQLPTPVAPSTK